MLHSPIQQMFTKHLWSARHWWTGQVKVCLRDPHSHRDTWILMTVLSCCQRLDFCMPSIQNPLPTPFSGQLSPTYTAGPSPSWEACTSLLSQIFSPRLFAIECCFRNKTSSALKQGHSHLGISITWQKNWYLAGTESMYKFINN